MSTTHRSTRSRTAPYSISCSPSCLRQSSCSVTLIVYPENHKDLTSTVGKNGSAPLVNNTSAHMLRGQKKCQKQFNEKVCPNRDSLHIGFFLLVHRQNVKRCEAIHKLATIPDGPYEDTTMDNTTVPIKICTNIERDSGNRVITSSVLDTKTPYLGNYLVSHHSQHDLLPHTAGW